MGVNNLEVFNLGASNAISFNVIVVVCEGFFANKVAEKNRKIYR
jgi:hypothetical protein